MKDFEDFEVLKICAFKLKLHLLKSFDSEDLNGSHIQREVAVHKFRHSKSGLSLEFRQFVSYCTFGEQQSGCVN
jgi:hypothetical protein